MAPRRWREEEAIDRSVRGVADDRHTPEDVEGWIREHGEKCRVSAGPGGPAPLTLH